MFERYWGRNGTIRTSKLMISSLFIIKNVSSILSVFSWFGLLINPVKSNYSSLERMNPKSHCMHWLSTEYLMHFGIIVSTVCASQEFPFFTNPILHLWQMELALKSESSSTYSGNSFSSKYSLSRALALGGVKNELILSAIASQLVWSLSRHSILKLPGRSCFW